MPKEKYNIQAGLKNLRILIQRFAEDQESSQPFAHGRTFIHEGLGGISMNRELAREYEKILQQLMPDEESELARSRGETDSLIQFCVLKALDILEKNKGPTLEQRIDSEINALQDQLKAPLVKWEVWRRIYGLKIPPDGFPFGRVLFCRPQHKAAREAKKAIEAKIDATAHAKYYHENLKLWQDDSQDVVLCRVEVPAGGGEGARHLAKLELDATFPVLNFFASAVSPTDAMPALALRETSGPDVVTDFALSGEGRWHWQMTEWRVSGGFDVNEFSKNEAVQTSLQKASAMLKNEGKNRFNDRLLSGMKWAGKGASARNKDDAFLFYAIALEALILGGNHKEQLSYRLRLRVGQLLGRVKSSKTRWRDITKALYLVRNAIVHNGRIDIASVDLDDLRFIVQFCLERILCHDEFAAISSDKALETWFEDSLMNAPEAAAEKAATPT